MDENKTEFTTEDENVEPVPDSESKGRFTAVTPLSKYITMTLFVVLPFLGFWIGLNYGDNNSADPIDISDVNSLTNELRNISDTLINTDDSSSTDFDSSSPEITLRTFTNSKFGYLFKYPSDWYVVYPDPICLSESCESAYAEYTGEGDESNVRRVIITDTEIQHDGYYNYETRTGNEIVFSITSIGERYTGATSVGEYWDLLGGTGNDRAYGVTNSFIEKVEINGIEMIIFEQYSWERLRQASMWTPRAIFMINGEFVWIGSSYDIDENEFMNFLSTIELIE